MNIKKLAIVILPTAFAISQIAVADSTTAKGHPIKKTMRDGVVTGNNLQDNNTTTNSNGKADPVTPDGPHGNLNGTGNGSVNGGTTPPTDRTRPATPAPTR